VQDHCRAIEAVLSSGHVGATYNVGGESEWSNLETVRLVAGLLDQAFAGDASLERRFPHSPARQGKTAALITHVPDRPGHDRRYAISNRKIRGDLGFEPAKTFEAGLRETVTWYLEHEEWWRRVIHR
jgi:dTDP-glucose 4,6-dehydratase